ncbi:MAG: hypothetical protein U0V70_03270 [Terriglobia bacterium]
MGLRRDRCRYGGTRTASITEGFVALGLALQKLVRRKGIGKSSSQRLRIAFTTSVGICGGAEFIIPDPL